MRKLIFTIYALAGVLGASILYPNKVNALGEASLSLGFSPTALYLNLNPGESYKGEVTFWNLAQSTITFQVKVKGFKQIEDVPGTSRIHTDFEEANDPYTASKWVTVDTKTVELHPNEYFKLPYTITVPQDVAIGEFHTLIYLQSTTPDNPLLGSATLADLGSGPAILINTGDNVEENAEVEYFKTDKPFYEYPPVDFLTRYLNKGNTHITPAGDIVLENFLGQEIDRIQFNPNKQSILRSNGATYTNEWQNKSIFFKNGKVAIGPIKAKLVTTYRSKFPGFSPLSATTTFWVLPWKIILGVMLTIAFILYLRSKAKEKKRVSNQPPVYYNNQSNEYSHYEQSPRNIY